MAALDATAAKERALSALKGFSPSQIVIILLLTAVSVGGAVAFLRWVNTPTYTVLLAGLDPKDAAAVTAQLDTDGVPYELEAGGATVLVPADRVQAERLKVAAAGLPAGKTDSGWAAFDGQGMTSSSFQQQVAYQRAMEGTLGQTLTGIEGVKAATVHLALPEKKVFTEQQQPTRASVLLDTTRTLDAGQVDAVSRLVSSSVPGLAPQDVSVSDASGRLLSADGGGARDRQTQTALEDDLSNKANTMLDQLLGPGQAVVRVSAELDTAKKTVDSETYDDSKKSVLRDNTAEEAYTTPEGAAGGVIANPADPAAQGQGSYSKRQGGREFGVSRTVTREEDTPGGIKRLTVAVAVNRDSPNAPTAAEVRDLVANAVGFDPTRGDTIAVSNPSFLKAPVPVPEPPPAGPVRSLADSAPTILGGVLLLLVALGFLRSLRRGSSKEVPEEEITAALASAGAAGALDEAPAAAAAKELPAGSAAAVDLPGQRTGSQSDLLELVDSKPDEVAALLRGWLATTSGDR